MKLENLSNAQILSALKSCTMLDMELIEKDYLRCFYIYELGDNRQIAKYVNGSGDDLVIAFKDDSILIKGFDHESEVSPYAQDEYCTWPGMYNDAPSDLLKLLEDKSFIIEDVTFCYWRLSQTGKFQTGSVIGLVTFVY